VVFLALAVAAVVAGLLVLTSGGASPKPAAGTSARSSNAPAAHHHRSKPAAALSPSSVTVAVLNGTATSGLAHRVALKLGTAGYKQGTVGNVADQTRTSTVVAYLPGHKSAATAVAAALKLGPASVQPVDANTQAVACPQPSACGATDVVVTVGSDLANTQ
jgi:LytR cell envelope-related transcriptional attenuator